MFNSFLNLCKNILSRIKKMFAETQSRRVKAFVIRSRAAKYYLKNTPILLHHNNGDENRFPNKVASFTKGLPHNELGEVDIDAYSHFLEVLKTGDANAFETISLGGERKLINPQASYAFELVGPDSHQLEIPSAPSFSSVEAADEMVELYWQALTRDIPFTQYNTNPLTISAANELSSLSDFKGPKVYGKVTPDTLFRGNTPGALEGPYISQFLWKDIPYVAKSIVQRYHTTTPNDNHLTSYRDWLSVQNGSSPPTPNVFDPIPRYIRNARDLGEYVHRDISIEDGLTPVLILLSYGNEVFDSSNPYLTSSTQEKFVTFGPPHVLDFVSRAARPGLESAWFQKWLVHRRLRPEEFGGRIHNTITGAANYPINWEVLNSEAVSQTFNMYGTYLLPQAYEEGCPTHPSYPAGHGVFIGAIVTMLKAFFNESFIIPDPVIASEDGLFLNPYDGLPLTVGGELDKLAYNIAIGRNGAGVHYRSEGINSLQLGEKVAIGILLDYKETYNEEFEGFSFTTFDGKKETV
ncbi:vanadium-dependent haloperoxidase [Bacillus spongiae]|uniref:Vanadium-dependent haloperoxidase n=1 Tax=Bacillus spongiae TaxID=2683610 RepID=A0ABU8HB89_9BACI